MFVILPAEVEVLKMKGWSKVYVARTLEGGGL